MVSALCDVDSLICGHGVDWDIMNNVRRHIDEGVGWRMGGWRMGGWRMVEETEEDDG